MKSAVAATIQGCAEFAFGHDNKSCLKVTVPSRNLRDLNIPKGIIAFYFYDEAHVPVQVGNRVEQWSNTVENSSSEVYFYGRLYSLARIRREFPGQKCLLNLMTIANDRYAVRNPTGQWHILDQGDLVLNPKTRRVTTVR